MGMFAGYFSKLNNIQKKKKFFFIHFLRFSAQNDFTFSAPISAMLFFYSKHEIFYT